MWVHYRHGHALDNGRLGNWVSAARSVIGRTLFTAYHALVVVFVLLSIDGDLVMSIPNVVRWSELVLLSNYFHWVETVKAGSRSFEGVGQLAWIAIEGNCKGSEALGLEGYSSQTSSVNWALNQASHGIGVVNSSPSPLLLQDLVHWDIGGQTGFFDIDRDWGFSIVHFHVELSSVLLKVDERWLGTETVKLVCQVFKSDDDLVFVTWEQSERAFLDEMRYGYIIVGLLNLCGIDLGFLVNLVVEGK